MFWYWFRWQLDLMDLDDMLEETTCGFFICCPVSADEMEVN